MSLAQTEKLALFWHTDVKKEINSVLSDLTNQLAKILSSKEVCKFPLLLKETMICFHLCLGLIVQEGKQWIWSKAVLCLYLKSKALTSQGKMCHSKKENNTNHIS